MEKGIKDPERESEIIGIEKEKEERRKDRKVMGEKEFREVERWLSPFVNTGQLFNLFCRTVVNSCCNQLSSTTGTADVKPLCLFWSNTLHF